MINIEIDYQSSLNKYSQYQDIIKYYNLLLEENKKINLVSRETIETDFYNLVTESIIPLDYLAIHDSLSYLDIGSGGGLPAIPIILTKDIKRAALVERTSKKAAAIERIYKNLPNKTDLLVIKQTFEEVNFENSFDLITLRYVKLTNRLLNKILEILSKNGFFIYYSSFDMNNCPDSCSVVTYSYSTGINNNNKYFSVIRKK